MIGIPNERSREEMKNQIKVIVITWYVLSNLSYMNLVMTLVFPTDWSPKNTSLYFARGDTGAIALTNDDRRREGDEENSIIHVEWCCNRKKGTRKLYWSGVPRKLYKIIVHRNFFFLFPPIPKLRLRPISSKSSAVRIFDVRWLFREVHAVLPALESYFSVPL